MDPESGLALRDCPTAEMIASPKWRIYTARQDGYMDGFRDGREACAAAQRIAR
jgi:hypothetical protein